MRLKSSIIVFLCWLWLPSVVHAQPFSSEDGISASGYKELELVPVRLRAEIQIRAEGKDAKGAIKALSDHKKSVRESLVAMKSEADTIEFGKTRMIQEIAGMSDDGDGNQNYAMVMQRAMMRGGIRVGGIPMADNEEEGDQTGPPKIFVAKSSVTADWVLPTKDLDALSLLPESLRSQIAQRDVPGKKIKAELSEEEKDAIANYQQQMAAQGTYYSGGPTSAPEIQTWFIAKLEPDQEKAAIKEAFEMATQNAKTLAEATGLKLGKLRRLTRSDSSMDEAQPIAYDYGPDGNIISRRTSHRNDHEVLSTTPGALSKRIQIHVVYAID